MSSIRKMSKFMLEAAANNCGRLGHFTLGELEISTPAFFIHTLTGSIPHITPDVLDYIFPPLTPRPPLQISIDSTMGFAESVGKFGKGIGKFVGLPDSPVFLTVHNPTSPLRGGYNDKSGIALWSRTGKRNVDLKTFGQIVTDFKPCVYQGLSDYDISAESSLKRIKKSTHRALEYLEELTSSKASNKGLFVTIESRWFSDEQEGSRTLSLMLEKLDQIEGFVISGLSSDPISKLDVLQKEKNDREIIEKAKADGNGKKKYTKAQIQVEQVDYELLDRILSKLPADKPRYVPGPFSPLQILEMVGRGVDLFDSSFVTQLADDGRVLVMDGLDKEFLHVIGIPENETLPSRSDGDEDQGSENSILISLKDKRYFNDFSPVSKTCSCYTCRKHTKAYINHLYATDELLGPVLTMIHNLTSFTKLFQAIRNSQRDANFSSTVDASLGKLKLLLSK